MKSTFKVLEGARGVQQKLVFVLGNLANLALAVYKCHSMSTLR